MDSKCAHSNEEGLAPRLLRLRPLRHIPQLQRLVVAARSREAAT
jgi:hypothetical protein